MKYIFSVVFLLMIFLITRAQKPAGEGKISGKVTDSATKKSVDYATISVYQLNGTKPVNGSTSNQKGAFLINNLSAGPTH